MGHNYHSFSIDATIMVSKIGPVIGELRVFLAGHIVAMVTYCATKLTATCSPMIGQFVDTMILASTGIEWL